MKARVFDGVAAIQTLEDLILQLEQLGHDTSSIRQFFAVGEWLIAFEGVEIAYSKLSIDGETREKMISLDQYFS
ncbi:hypothetical protein [Agrobacterium vaccinii]|uniref:hypothetical protein n=1 Tax=Agrobacterium vaccinii TaxID=2735528 RepID=UPI001E4CFADE|nr:hypothetical protein [Agrobacterium vaccinii]UHS59542.1 hypothetical protein HRS00_22300 [Agrobacterium vaccinii]